MATGTRRIGGPEAAANVTALTRYVAMCAIQDESGTEVVERGLCMRILRRKQAGHSNQNVE